MALGLLECSRPKEWPSSWTATRKRLFPMGERHGQWVPAQFSLLQECPGNWSCGTSRHLQSHNAGGEWRAFNSSMS